VQEYTISEASKKIGIEKRRIMRLIRAGKIKATKGKGSRSPYKIGENELQKLRDIEESKTSQKEDKAVFRTKIEVKPDYVENVKYYGDFIQIQKVLVETMRDLATTQEQIAATLRELVKKV